AAQRQAIVNSDAALDLAGRSDGALAGLQHCVSVPLVSGDTLAAVLTLYGSPPLSAGMGGRLAEGGAPRAAGGRRAAPGPAPRAAIDAAAAAQARTAMEPPAAQDKPASPALRLVATR